MKQTSILILFLPVLAVIAGCATTTTTEYSYRPHLYQEEVREGTVLREFAVEPEVAEKILALDPDNISEKEIQEVLSHAPAPRIINIHGGIYPVYLLMISFSEFLISMGYPEESIRNPMDGSYSYSCYMDSEKIAGLIAWYYEREGMRPMMVGHSQGGIQAVKVLYELAGRFDSNLRVWNPLTDRAGCSLHKSLVRDRCGSRRVYAVSYKSVEHAWQTQKHPGLGRRVYRVLYGS
jgi:hypothetical protein